MKVIPIQRHTPASRRPRVRPRTTLSSIATGTPGTPDARGTARTATTATVTPIGTQAATITPEPVHVNGQTISVDDIALEAQNHPMDNPESAWQAAARALVWRTLFLQEAKQRGLQPDPMELEPGQWETDEEALIRQLFDLVIDDPDTDEAGLRAHYDRHRERYRGPSLYEAAHILFMAPEGDPAAQDQARKRAEAVRQELTSHPQRFARLARDHSDCPSAEQGGLMGQLASGDVVPEFETVLRELEEGEISMPAESRYGYHIVRLDQRALGQPLPFESVLPQLRQAAEKAHWVRESRRFMQQLLARSDIRGMDMTGHGQPE